jgi:lipid-A-disaccharide synthase
MSAGNKSLVARLRSQSGRSDETGDSPRDAPPEGPHSLRPSDHDELTVFMVAGEHSGDALGAGLMAELTRRRKGLVRFIGVGGEAMEAEGLTSLFPLSDMAVMGPTAILKALPRLTNRVYRTVAAGLVAKPDVIVIIDSPEFTHRVAKRLRPKLPHTPIIDYVCPSVWAWRPGRAKVMARHIDHVLCLLPFEPAALERLRGPPATFVGHPLAERREWIRGLDLNVWTARLEVAAGKTPLVVLPGSRRSEVEQLMPVFGETVAGLGKLGHDLELLLPAVPHLRSRIETLAADWPMRPRLIDGEEAKFAAFRLARAALAASGTVTLQLGLAGTPMVVAYRVDGLAARFRRLIKVPSVVLANLVLGENAFPEYLQEDCTPEKLCGALDLVLKDTPERRAQLAALERVAERMSITGATPSALAANVVVRHAERSLAALRP